DPRNRSPAALRRPRLEPRRAAQNQALLGTCHRHVEQPPLLARLRLELVLAQLSVCERGYPLARAGLCEPQPETAVAPHPNQPNDPARTTSLVVGGDDRTHEA